ncbi:MAG: T9SS type A sorting domain-containing protein [Bacteroidetes bacterium]|jgi:hypothetical protein|nr:T9SS type A sorting domain-containing protein [Bacteroidota bacterium]MBK7569114.1 T9SS type A sorting domain-containing protein [Bacteroidota bacterium]MBP8915222.1 T9SS type A sorting domain-containing protein [Chitinophagales bacterium]MBP9795864.1 T9SS type A sorting domain-containing protein [Chitinophagales bacterium]
MFKLRLFQPNTFVSLLFMCLLTNSTRAQAPSIEWQKCYGGTFEDYARDCQNTTDGGFVFVGTSTFANGDVTVNHGYDDYWIIKTSSTGIIQWQVSVGGSEIDFPRSIEQTSDDGYIICGFSKSNDYDVSGHHGGSFYSDFWVVKLNSTGTLIWQKSLGGTDHDSGYSVKETSDGGYIVAGEARSNDGDVSGHHGFLGDYWIAKLDASGNITWQKCYGGTDGDVATDILETSDGGFIIAGYAFSNDFDVVGNHGNSDFWIIKLSNVGNVQWKKCYGGIYSEEAQRIKPTPDGGYIIIGTTHSNNGDVSGKHDSFDYWVVKIDINGTLQWQKCLGGDSEDYGYGIDVTSDGGYIVTGYTLSNNGDVSGNHGDWDFWVVKLNESGSLLWQKCLGGTSYDRSFSIKQAPDGGYIIAGYSISENGDITFNHGGYDFWVVKLSADCVAETCNALDDNCNGLIDDGVVETINISAGGPIIFCQGSSVLLTATYSGATVQWKKNGANIPGATSSTYSVTKTGDYTCVTTSPCGTATSSLIHVTVNKNPTASITAGGATTFCAGGSVTLTEAPVGGSTYQWYKGASTIAGATSTNYIATAPGNYKCRVTKTASGCFKNSNTITVTVPCKEGEELMNEENNNFTIFPNPNNGTFNLVFNVPIGGISPLKGGPRGVITLQIFNSLSQQIHSQQINSPEGNINETISIDNLSSGIYIIRLNNGINYSDQKFMIE